MMKQERTLYLPESTVSDPTRIVFQLDLRHDTLHYYHWVDMEEGEQTEGTIRAFHKVLHEGQIVHPDDLCACERIIQNQTTGLKIKMSDIRLHWGNAGYAWFRIRMISSHNPQDEMHVISGVLESLKDAREAAFAEQTGQDTLFRKAVTSNALLSLGFDGVTGSRMVSDSDILPYWMPQGITLMELIKCLQQQVVYPEDQTRALQLFKAVHTWQESAYHKPFFGDCRLPDLSKQTKDIRWYRIYHAFIKETHTTPACFYLTVFDIHEVKSKEHLIAEQATFDQTTGMLKWCAFENQITCWLQQVKSEGAYAYVCAAVVMIDNTMEVVNKHGYDYLSQKVLALSNSMKAFIHPHEMCGRFGLDGFAVALTGLSLETLGERLRILQIICDTLNREWADLQLCLGSNVEPVSQAEQGDLFLEKAYWAYQTEKDNDSTEKVAQTPSHEITEKVEEKGAGMYVNSRAVPAAQRKHQIFIRTFGHFDVFVDGEAVLFNHSKAKELLALLIDRRGGFLGATEAIACLWEDEPANNTTLSRCRKAALHLKQTLARYGIGYLMETVNGKRHILVELCDCDYYQYLQQTTLGSHKIPESYMNDYSWAEKTIADE